MTEPQILEFVSVHNFNPISPTLGMPLQFIESVDTKPSTPLHPNQS